MKSTNATANRMANEASEKVADTVQDIVDELAETQVGENPADVKDAVQEKWAEKQGDAAPPLSEDKAAEYAEHISQGRDVTVVPAHDEADRSTPPAGRTGH